MPIIIERLSHTYQKDTPFQVEALHDINLTIRDGEFIGLIGPTGSGKSTLIQHLNGLLRASSGRVIVDGEVIGENKQRLRDIRQKVGLIFQYPEHQLFEETVFADIAFGPKNLGLEPEEIQRRVTNSMKVVGLPEELVERSPFELSGGQMRRVAIAGVLAMEPNILILDEPTAGLDPRGRDEILGQIEFLHKKLNLTTILVSHSMEDIARLVDRLIVMHKGTVLLQGTPREVFAEEKILEEIGLAVPQVKTIMTSLRDQGMDVSTDVLNLNEAENEIMKYFKKRTGGTSDA